MNYYKLAQIVGVVMAGLGVGLIYALPDAHGGSWTALGLIVYAVGRLVPWLRKRE